MKYFMKKICTLIITLLLISFLSFAAFSVIPGDAALTKLGKDATEEQLVGVKGINESLAKNISTWYNNHAT